MAATSREFELRLTAKNMASAAIKSVTNELKKSGEHVKSINEKFNLLFSAAIVQQVGGFVKSMVDANDALNDMADRTGISVENLSKLAEVAQAGDTSVETLTKALNKLNIEAVKSPETFEALGIEVLDAGGKMKNSEALFGDVADKISKIDNPARRAAIATQVFGKAGLELMPILKSGRDGIKGWTDDAERLGAVTSTSLAQASGEFNDNIQRLTMSAKGMSNAFAAEVLPSINLLVGAFVEYSAEAAALEKGNEQAESSIESLAKSDSFKTLISVIGFIGDAIQGFANVAQVAFGLVKFNVGQAVNAFVTLGAVARSVFAGDFKGAIAAYKQGLQQASDLVKDFQKTGDSALSGERFSDKLARGLQAAVQKGKASAAEAKKVADDTAAGLTKAGSVSLAAATNIVNGATTQIKNITKVSEEATAKSKKAVEDQKKVAEEFEAISKRLTKKDPANGTLAQNLAKAERDQDKREKIAAFNEKALAKEREKSNAERLEQLQEAAEKTKAAYAAESGMNNKAKMEAAEAALESEKAEQEKAERMQEYIGLQKELAKEELSSEQRMDARLAATRELNDLYAQIKENGTSGTENEAEIKRLKDIAALLQKDKDEKTGIFSTSEIENYAKEIKDLANVAAKADADTATKTEDIIMANAKKRLEELQKDLLSVKFGIDEESVNSEADKLLDTIQNKLKGISIPVALKMPDTYDNSLQFEAGPDPIKRANGGAVYGPGTTTSDSIPALLSNKEHVVNARAAEQPGVRRFLDYLNAGGNLSGIMRLAQGGSVGNVVSTEVQTTNLSIDLRTDKGTIKLPRNPKQEDLEAAIRKANLRRS